MIECFWFHSLILTQINQFLLSKVSQLIKLIKRYINIHNIIYIYKKRFFCGTTVDGDGELIHQYLMTNTNTNTNKNTNTNTNTNTFIRKYFLWNDSGWRWWINTSIPDDINCWLMEPLPAEPEYMYTKCTTWFLSILTFDTPVSNKK